MTNKIIISGIMYEAASEQEVEQEFVSTLEALGYSKNEISSESGPDYGVYEKAVGKSVRVAFDDLVDFSPEGVIIRFGIVYGSKAYLYSSQINIGDNDISKAVTHIDQVLTEKATELQNSLDKTISSIKF